MSPHRLALALLMLVGWLGAHAMDFERRSLQLGASGSVQAIALEGAVREGDAKRFEQFLSELDGASETPVLWLTLNSDGGSVREALGIARLIRRHGFITHVPAESRCVSACIFLYSAGLVRVPALTPPNSAFRSNIGIHRAFFSRDFLASLSLSQAQELTRLMNQSLERAFREFDIPPHLYQSALMTASSQVHWLSEAETRSLGTYPAWFDEYLLAKCRPVRPAESASASSDRSLTSRDKSACAMRLLQDHRKQQKGVPMAAPPAAD
jgi:hypothetical protein